MTPSDPLAGAAANAGADGSPGGQAAGERRLPPIALLFALLGSLQRYALPLLAVVFFSRGDGYEKWLLFFLLPSFGIALAKYLTFTYSFGHDELVIRSGLFQRQERHIPYARVQNVDLRQNVLHRLAKVAAVRLETGSGGDAEAEIEVLTEAAIAELRAAIFRPRELAAMGRAATETAALGAAMGAAAPAVEAADGEAAAAAEGRLPPAAARAAAEVPRRLLELGPGELVLRGLLTGRGFILVAAAFGFGQQSGIFRVDDQIGRLTRRLGFDGASAGALADQAGLPGLQAWLQSFLTLHNLVLAILVLVMLAAGTRLLSVLWTLATFWGFRLSLRGESLSTEQGLFTRVSATLPRHRIQALELRTGYVDGLFGRAALVAATAGRGISSDEQARNPGKENAELFLAPIAPREQAEKLMRELAAGSYEEDLDWRGFAPGTLARLVRKRLLLVAALGLLLFWLLGLFGLAAAALLGLYQVVSAKRYVERSRWALGRQAMFWRTGAFGEIFKIVPLEKMQVVVLASSPFDRRRGTATLRVDTAATDVGYPTLNLPYLEAGEARQLAARLERETARRAFQW